MKSKLVREATAVLMVLLLICITGAAATLAGQSVTESVQLVLAISILLSLWRLERR